MENNNMEIVLSVVAPAYNEYENIEPLLKQVSEAICKLDISWEFIIVNDCSQDETLPLLKKMMNEYGNLRVLSMGKRSGQTAAIDAGFSNAKGLFIAMLDSDLQNDPADIPKMLELIKNNQCDMVNGWRKYRNDPWIRLLSSKIANSVRNWLTHENIHDSACGLKVFRRECIERVKFFNGMHRFMPTLVKMEGYKVIEMPVNHRPRQAGVAKYGIGNRVFKALRDAFAIRWMQSRIILYRVKEEGDRRG